MKVPFLACLVLAVCLISSGARADEAADLAAIRALYSKISEGKPTKTETIKFEVEESVMEGSITRRSYDGGLSAIKLSYSAGDHGGSEQSYYYDGKGLFLILVQDSSWYFVEGGTAEKPKTADTLTETRYYVKGGAIIEVLEKSATVTTGDGKKLEDLIAKAGNKKVEEKKRDPFLLKRAAALVDMKTKEQAQKFFAAEE
ncbi:hypothetical protein [Luteolibacter sp. Populi]|uniref:hypothetical protein n=1 Tax=Luteolibacter sp. Populi TaxID=3230487 RepID=UPI003466AF20